VASAAGRVTANGVYRRMLPGRRWGQSVVDQCAVGGRQRAGDGQSAP
jgi:hypothetical protein